ncbi:MAG TPA: hypothetical protein VLZ50_06880 [Terracidiphilus sp.]|nr:hypothetical protein [Terracidiphilus sp.]
MNSSLAVLEARGALATMRRLRNQIGVFATHARALNSMAKNFDSAALVEEANQLLEGLKEAKKECWGASSKIETLARSLSSRPQGRGMSPAAQYGPELRAARRQFADAVRDAEKALGQLYSTGMAGLNSPTRVSTSPDSVFELVLMFSDLLVKWIEHARNKPKK